MKRSNFSQAGSALMMALLCALVLGSLTAATFFVVEQKYRVIHQAAAWDESLLSAEAGVEMAMNEIRKDLHEPGTAWSGWQHTTDLIEGSGATTSSLTYTLSSQTLHRDGEGSQSSYAVVSVDTPPSLKDQTGEQWYRIRSIGVAEIPGTRVLAGDKQDIDLRKLSFLRNRHTGEAVDKAIATRSIEAIAKPVGAFRLALLGTGTIDMTDQGIVVDSYDSRDPAKSTNGMYDPAKRQEHGDVATNGQVINAGSAHIYGDAMTNGGNVWNSSNVSGEVRNDFFQEVFSVQKPTSAPDAGTPALVNNSATFTALATGPSNYQLSSINLSGQSVLHIAGASDGSPRYCQIIVTGDISLSGQAMIQVDPGVYLRVFVQGNVDISGQGIVNPNSPLYFQMYGCDRPPNPDGSPAAPGSIKIAGNGSFSGSVYAPTYTVEMKGGGSSSYIAGAFVGKSVTLTGIQKVHYDEALGEGGLISDFKIVSWFEDER